MSSIFSIVPVDVLRRLVTQFCCDLGSVVALEKVCHASRQMIRGNHESVWHALFVADFPQLYEQFGQEQLAHFWQKQLWRTVYVMQRAPLQGISSRVRFEVQNPHDNHFVFDARGSIICWFFLSEENDSAMGIHRIDNQNVLLLQVGSKSMGEGFGDDVDDLQLVKDGTVILSVFDQKPQHVFSLPNLVHLRQEPPTVPCRFDGDGRGDLPLIGHALEPLGYSLKPFDIMTQRDEDDDNDPSFYTDHDFVFTATPRLIWVACEVYPVDDDTNMCGIACYDRVYKRILWVHRIPDVIGIGKIVNVPRGLVVSLQKRRVEENGDFNDWYELVFLGR